MKNERKVFNIKKVADYLGVHPSTIYRYAQTNKIPAFKIDSDWRFSRKHIDQWIDQRVEKQDQENEA